MQTINSKRESVDNHLNSLLADWHAWASNYKPVAAIATSPMFRPARTSRQWDTENDAVDGRLHAQTMEALDAQVRELSSIHQTALQMAARNLACGASVWRSPRLPDDPHERAIIVGHARAALLRRLMASGVM